MSHAVVICEGLGKSGPTEEPPKQSPPEVPRQDSELHSLKYHLLGPSLTKAGQESVDQAKVSEIIYNASKGSKFFLREKTRDQDLTVKIAQILTQKKALEGRDLWRERRAADQLVERLELTRDLTQHIVHVDCDAFYAAVEQLDRPELRDRPFAVGGGVVTTCNYVARRFGVRSGMPGFVAQKLCPELEILPTHFDKYHAKAGQVRAVLADYDARFESSSIDEAFLNITDYCCDNGVVPADAVQLMRAQIHARTGVTVSAGLAANTRLAKICSNLNKPNGQYVLPSDRRAIVAFMAALPVRKVPGIGRVLERQLTAVGIAAIGDVYPHRQLLAPLFGDKAAEFLLACYLGLGRTQVHPADEYERKSVGSERTFASVSDPRQLREKLRQIADDLARGLARTGARGRTLRLKIKLHTFEVLSRQVVASKALHGADDLYACALPLLARLEQEMPGMTIRLLGLRCTQLTSAARPDPATFFTLRSGPSPGKRRAAGPDDEPDAHLADDSGSDVDQALEFQDDGPVHGYHDLAAKKARAGSPPHQQERWECPICLRPQQADELGFNQHIDMCLSRATIRDAVQEADLSPPGGGSAAATAVEAPNPLKRPGPGGLSAHRVRAGVLHRGQQLKLSFGMPGPVRKLRSRAPSALPP